MKVREVFDQLRYGELSQLSLPVAANGSIAKSEYPKLLAHLSLGLTALYKRFALKEGRVWLALQPNQGLYVITSAYAVTGRSRMAVRYLLDNPPAAPFRDDLLKIEQVMTEEGVDMPLNDKGHEWSVFTPATASLRVPMAIVNQSSDVPDVLKTSKLELVYRANHPAIDVDMFDEDYTDIELPHAYLEALLLFMASRIHSPLGMASEGAIGNNYLAKYEAACQRLEAENLHTDQTGQYDRLREKGWV
jgi:hypothetical protein